MSTKTVGELVFHFSSFTFVIIIITLVILSKIIIIITISRIVCISIDFCSYRRSNEAGSAKIVCVSIFFFNKLKLQLRQDGVGL